MSNMPSRVKKVYWCDNGIRVEYEICYTPNYSVVYIWVYYPWVRTPIERILPLRYWSGEELFCETLSGRLC